VNGRICSVAVRHEQDVVLARQRARQIAGLLGFDKQDQTRVATAVSEIARNAFRYAGGGNVDFSLDEGTAPGLLEIRVADRGPGITDLERILEGRYSSPTGMGIGLTGARRLMDHFTIETAPQRGTTVVLRKLLPRHAKPLDNGERAAIAAELTRQRPHDPVQEVQQQNQELLRALGELTRRQEDLVALNRELEDTNRGVVALYAELDERADHLRRADDVKSRFLSNMSHEFRTPVNSIQALSRMLLDRLDGELSAEQERQVLFIRKAADSLSELVNDLLDLAKVEAGKIVVRPGELEIANLFGALRGMLRPLLVNESVSLVFDEPHDIPPLYTDEAKISQILRNFVSNALKFTERGEVRVAARALDDGQVEFSVSDTGIGIAIEDHERIFHEFSQVDNPLQRRVKGTGLGLPLCRKLAHLLGGTVTVSSAPHLGSTFRLTVPAQLATPAPSPVASWTYEPDTIAVLVVEDDADLLQLYEKYVAGTPFRIYGARSLREAREALSRITPRVIVLDILLGGEEAWTFLTELKRRESTSGIPVVIVSTVDDTGKGIALGADVYCAKPVDRQLLLSTLQRLVAPDSVRKILIVDDEEVSRYVLRQSLAKTRYLVLEAAGGEEGLRLASEERPDLICLDLTMPDGDGFDLLHRLKSDSRTRNTPVVIVTSRALDEPTRAKLLESASAVVSKEQTANLVAVVEQTLLVSAEAAPSS
jgi:signal transduction histidine kinase/CheY-like chemotaxis protein